MFSRFFLLRAVIVFPRNRLFPNRSPAPTFSELPEAPRFTGITWPGKKMDGSVLLPNSGRCIRPGARSSSLIFRSISPCTPMGDTRRPPCRYSEHQILIVDLLAGEVIQDFASTKRFYGLEFSQTEKLSSAAGRGRGVAQVHFSKTVNSLTT